MMRRKSKSPTPPDTRDAPAWLFRFDYAAWLPGCSPEYPDPDRVGPFMGPLAEWLAARRRWHAEAHDWLAERGLFMEDHRQPFPGVREWLDFKEDNPHLVVDRRLFRARADTMRQRVKALDQDEETMITDSPDPYTTKSAFAAVTAETGRGDGPPGVDAGV